MRPIQWMTIALSALVVSTGQAQDEDAPDVETLDVTMRLMSEHATLPDAVTRVIELPETAADAARQNAADGLETANAARGNAAGGLEIAAEAREQGAERAQEARENAGRAPPEVLEELPLGPPGEIPGPTPLEELPGPPVEPGPQGN